MTVRIDDKKNHLRNEVIFLVTPWGVGLASRVAVALLGLATVSRFRLVTEYRSDVRLPTHMPQGMYCVVTNKNAQPKLSIFIGEPTTRILEPPRGGAKTTLCYRHRGTESTVSGYIGLPVTSGTIVLL